MSDNLLAKCIQNQNSELLQKNIDDGLIDLKNKNIVKIFYAIDNLYWKENQDIKVDFFEALLKNNIPLDSNFSKEHKQTIIDKIIMEIESDRINPNHLFYEINKKYNAPHKQDQLI